MASLITEKRFSSNDESSINFHDAKMPSEISDQLFKSISRVMPEPALSYEDSLLEPLTSVFAEY